MTDGLTIVHTSDWHIGMTREHLSPASRTVFADARVDAVERLCECAADHSADAIVVAGDIFDNPQISSRHVTSTLDLLAEAPCPVLVLPGNHDSLQAGSLYTSRAFRQACPDNVVIPSSPGVVTLSERLEVVVGPFNLRFPERNPLLDAFEQACEAPAPGIYRIAVGHGSSDKFMPVMDPTATTATTSSSSQAERGHLLPLEQLEKALTASHLRYIALGDRHSVTSLGSTGRIWYSGSPVVTNFDDVEKDSGSVLVVKLRDDEISVTPERIGRWAFHTINATVREKHDSEQLVEKLNKRPQKNRTAIRLALDVALPSAELGELDENLSRIADVYAGFHIWESNSRRRVLASPEYIGDNLHGYVREAAQQLERMATAEEGEASQDSGEATKTAGDASVSPAVAAQDALVLLYQLLAQEDEAS